LSAGLGAGPPAPLGYATELKSFKNAEKLMNSETLLIKVREFVRSEIKKNISVIAYVIL